MEDVCVWGESREDLHEKCWYKIAGGISVSWQCKGWQQEIVEGNSTERTVEQDSGARCLSEMAEQKGSV